MWIRKIFVLLYLMLIDNFSTKTLIFYVRCECDVILKKFHLSFIHNSDVICNKLNWITSCAWKSQIDPFNSIISNENKYDDVPCFDIPLTSLSEFVEIGCDRRTDRPLLALLKCIDEKLELELWSRLPWGAPRRTLTIRFNGSNWWNLTRHDLWCLSE